jgi:hypothetical protein
MRYILCIIIGIVIGKYGFSKSVHKTAEVSKSAISAADKAASTAEEATSKTKDAVKDAQDKIK